MPRGPHSRRDLQEVAIKSAALAPENFALALEAEGFSSCMMEGYDARCVKKLLRMSWSSRELGAEVIEPIRDAHEDSLAKRQDDKTQKLRSSTISQVDRNRKTPLDAHVPRHLRGICLSPALASANDRVTHTAKPAK
jgi:hypothetical protein